MSDEEMREIIKRWGTWCFCEGCGDEDAEAEADALEAAMEGMPDWAFPKPKKYPCKGVVSGLRGHDLTLALRAWEYLVYGSKVLDPILSGGIPKDPVKFVVHVARWANLVRDVAEWTYAWKASSQIRISSNPLEEGEERVMTLVYEQEFPKSSLEIVFQEDEEGVIEAVILWNAGEESLDPRFERAFGGLCDLLDGERKEEGGVLWMGCRDLATLPD